MAITTEGKEIILDKLLQVIQRGGPNSRVNVGNSSYDGLGTAGNDVNCIVTGGIPFSRTNQTLGLTNSFELLTIPSDDSYTVDRVYITDGTSVDGTTDTVVFQSIGLATANDTDYTVGGNWVINTFDITISEVL